jgi:hypothetical protein
VREREHGEQLLAAVVELRAQEGAVRGDTLDGQAPGQLRPGDAVDREPVRVEVQESRAGVELDAAPDRLVAQAAEPVRPRVEQRDPQVEPSAS